MGSIHLVRHGQASFGSENYDQLSALGEKQSIALGNSWEAGAWVPTAAIAGSMVRHAQTAIAALDIVEGDGYDVDAGWNEYDHIGIATALDPKALSQDSKAFQVLLNEAISRWRRNEGEFHETYALFKERVLTAFEAAVKQAGKGQRVAVFTSGGPIAMIMSHLLAKDDSMFQTLNDVVINAGVTTIINGATGPRLLTFNEHTHLPSDLVTFR